MQTDTPNQPDPQDIFSDDTPERGRPQTSGSPETQGMETAKAFLFEDLEATLGVSQQYIQETIAAFAGTEKEAWAQGVQQAVVETQQQLRDIQLKYYESSGTVKNPLGEPVKIFLREYDERAFDAFVPKYGEAVRQFNEYVSAHLVLESAL